MFSFKYILIFKSPFCWFLHILSTPISPSFPFKFSSSYGVGNRKTTCVRDGGGGGGELSQHTNARASAVILQLSALDYYHALAALTNTCVCVCMPVYACLSMLSICVTYAVFQIFKFRPLGHVNNIFNTYVLFKS